MSSEVREDHQPSGTSAPGGAGRWLEAAGGARQLVLIGDSTTLGIIEEDTGEEAISWVDLLVRELGGPAAASAEGFRGLWRGNEWTRHGAWIRATRADVFDVAPFGHAFISSGTSIDEVIWTRRPDTTVEAFDLYSVVVPGIGDWQYRVDDGPWQNIGRSDPAAGVLATHPVDQPVLDRVTIRGFDGSAPCVASIVGIGLHSTARSAPRTRTHHLGIAKQQLWNFCRPTAGDPFAVLDAIRPELVIVTFTNDAVWDAPAAFEASLRSLVERVEAYADVLLISPFEQRPPRRVDDAVTSTGSRRMRSASAGFVASDVDLVVRGTNIPLDPETTIGAVLSDDEVELSAGATGDADGGTLVIGEGREVDVQVAYRAVTRRVAESTGCRHLDLYQEWSEEGATGWDAAAAKGLMVDRFHQTTFGHEDIVARVLAVLESEPPEAREPVGGDAPAFVAPPEIVPGAASVVVSTSGTVELLIPVSLSFASTLIVTVDWRTRIVEDDPDHVQAPPSDYVAASGTLTFEPGQTDATVAVTITGNSTGVDERLVVSFTDPTNALMGGFWGLAFGTIHPAA